MKTNNLFKYGFFILAACIVCMLLFRPQPKEDARLKLIHIWDSITLAKQSAKIYDLKITTIEDKETIDSLEVELIKTDKKYLKTVQKLKEYTYEQLDSIKYVYIEKGSDSLEAFKTVELFKELDFCKDQDILKNRIIKIQSKTINDLDEIITGYEAKEKTMLKMIDNRDQIIAENQKKHKKQLRRTKIFAGLAVTGVLVLAVIVAK